MRTTAHICSRQNSLSTGIIEDQTPAEEEEEARLEAFGGQFPPVFAPTSELVLATAAAEQARQHLPSAGVPCSDLSAQFSSSETLLTWSQSASTNSTGTEPTVLALQGANIKVEPRDSCSLRPQVPSSLQLPSSTHVLESKIKMPPQEVKLECKDDLMSMMEMGGGSTKMGVVIVGRSGLTPPPSPTPLQCNEEVQIVPTRHVTEQSPHKRCVVHTSSVLLNV